MGDRAFDDLFVAIRRRVARRRAWLGSIAIVVSIALVVAVLIATRSTTRRTPIDGAQKEVASAKLPRLDAVVVLPAKFTNADAERVEAILDTSDAVTTYAPFPRATLIHVFGPFGATALRRRACADPFSRGYGLVLSRPARAATRELTVALGTSAFVHVFGKLDVDIEVFMKVHASAAQVADVDAALARDPDVVKTTYIDHQAAFEEFKRLFHDEPALIEDTRANDLPESFRLELRDGATTEDVTQRFEALPGVQSANALFTGRWTNPEPTFPSDEVEIFMEVRASAAEITAVQASLVDDATVKAFRFLTKEDAYKEFKALFGDEPTLIEGTDPSALPTSFRVTLRDPDAASDFELSYRAFAGVNAINTSSSALADACTALP